MVDSNADRGPAGPDPDITQAMEPPELVRLLDQYMAELNCGAVPDRARLLAEHPDLASQLEQCLAGIEFIHRAGMPAGDPTHLGDFRILRELGRGGMGVVYEAEQLSLRRRVALKVLRFGAVADKEAVQRFQREGETVAHLHHTNIVPIFAIGSENGVAFYAMQYIDGASLADVAARQTAGPNAEPNAQPAPFTEIARWGLEAAEALAHAHQRGVIHRDVKPSNLLLDVDGRVWLTDFGLARRMDDVTLTMVGLAGTPRYMSPEQATAVRRPIDHRTDIYSLGATLYELATGRPLFASDTPHGVISQILTVEPIRPRIVRSSIPRDLETIILKCLAKEPAQRYATAQALADDLRAFREGRAVRARRARLPERAFRWAKSRKKSMAIAVVAAIVTLGVTAGIFVAARVYVAARTAYLDVPNHGRPLKVEVFDEAERNVVATFTAPTQQAQPLPPGKYHVRFSADGLLSETSLFDAAPGGYYNRTTALGPREPREIPIAGGESVEVARIDGRDDLFLPSENKLRRLRGDTGQPVWEISLLPVDQPLVVKVLTDKDNGQASVIGTLTALVRPLADLEGDGPTDLIWAGQHSASLVAISGKTGKVLWCHRGQIVPADGGPNASTAFDSIIFHNEAIVGQPLIADVRGKKIVVAMYSVVAPHSHPQVWLEGLSALNGETLWRRPLPPNPDQNEIFHPSRNCVSACGKLQGRAIGAIAYGSRLIGFDFLTGEPAWPERVLDATPPVAIRFTDLLGDGQTDVVFVREQVPKTYIGDGRHRDLSVVAISPLLPAPLWEKPLSNVTLSAQAWQADSLFDWPLVVDLAGKGHPDVVVPWVEESRNSCGVEVLDARTGVTRWKRRLSGADRNWLHAQPDRMVAGGDLAADGCRELFVASCDERNARAYVDDLAGSDGSSRWTYSRSTKASRLSLRWWQPGRDGRAMLVVSGLSDDVYDNGSTSLVMLASTGHIEHLLSGFGDPHVADLNGDGIPDLFAYSPGYSSGTPNTPFKLRVIRGVPPPAWRLLSNDTLVPTQDLNGDGIADLVYSRGKKAISGRDGTPLWENSSFAGPADPRHIQWEGNTFGVFGAADPRQTTEMSFFRKDGAAALLSVDVKAYKSVTLRASSGRDGAPLWAAEFKGGAGEMPKGTGAVLVCPVFQSGGSQDVLFAYESQKQVANATITRSWLARIAGHDGEILWRQPLSEEATSGAAGPIALADLDGDGVDDIVLWVPLKPTAAATAISPPAGNDAGPGGIPWFELRAYSGRDGKLLWRRPGFYDESGSSLLSALSNMPRPLVISDNGHPEILITDVQLRKDREKSYAQIVALDGRDGKNLWSWRGDDAQDMDWWVNWANAAPQAARTSAGVAIVTSVFNRKLALPGEKEETSAPKGGHQIVVLDARGRVLTRTDVLSEHAENATSHCRPRVWVHDLDGDGSDELIWSDESSIRAMHAGNGKLLWDSKVQSPAPDNAILAILPAGEGYPATVAVNAADRLVGLAGPSGKVRWQCESSGTADLLETSDPLGLPRVWDDGAGTCRVALPADDAGVYLATATMDVEHPEPQEDPRLLVPLPWTASEFTRRAGMWSLGPPLLMAAIAIVILVCWRPIRWRRHAMLITTLFAFWVGLTIAGKVGLQLSWPATYVAMAMATTIWAVRRPPRGRRIAALNAGWVGLTLLGAAGWLWFDSRSMLPSERYDWSGWHRGDVSPMFMIGITAVTGLVIASGMFRLIYRAFTQQVNKSVAGDIVGGAGGT